MTTLSPARRTLSAIRYTAHTLLHPPVDFMAPPRPTAIERSSLSVDVDVARGPNLTGEVRPADWTQGPHEAWLSGRTESDAGGQLELMACRTCSDRSST